jgi:uncharacterized protein
LLKVLRSWVLAILAAMIVSAGLSATVRAQSAPPAQAPAAQAPATGPAARPASAGDDGSAASTTFLTPFPEADVYKLQVYGDSFAEGLASALADAFANDSRVQVNRRHKPIGSLTRAEWEDDIKPEDGSRETVHVAVIMLGLQDRQIIRGVGVTPLSIGTGEWQAEYGRRLERLVRALKKRNAAVYVVGQPILRQPNANSQAEILSEIMRRRASANGAKFVDILEAFQEDGGGFSQFGPDISGTRVKLRDGDGVTFTGNGNKKLAHFVERDVRRDVDQAASDRLIPLAGDDLEQKRVNPGKAGAATTAGWRGSVTVGQPRSAVQPQVPVAPTVADTTGDLKADNGKVTIRTLSATGRDEAITLDIIRPAIPAAVVALVTRREASTDKSAQPGEALVDDIGSGLTVVSTISSLGETAQATPGSRRKVTATQSAYYTVLVKGDRLPPRPGRADDFSWPKPEATLAADPTQPPAPAQASGSRPAAPKTTPLRPAPKG